MTNYAPLHDRILVEVDPVEAHTEKKTTGGIILVQQTTQEYNPLAGATVLAIGGGEVLYDGTIRQLAVKPGDRVLLHRNEVLSVAPSHDPSVPVVGIIGERALLAILSGEPTKDGEEQGGDIDPSLLIGKLS